MPRPEQVGPAGLHLGEQLLQPSLVPHPGPGSQRLVGPAKDPQGHSVADLDVVRRERARRADPDVEGVRLAVQPTAGAHVTGGVEEEQHRAVLLSGGADGVHLPVRSVVRQLTRLSRSPGWKGRIAKNSEPSPPRRDLFCPISPTGCGVSPEVKARASGRATTFVSGSRWGPHR